MKWLSILAATVTVAALQPQPARAADAAAPKTIAVIPKGTTHEFWKAVHAGASRAEAETSGVKVVWQGPLREDDRNSQIQIVQSHVSKGTSAICLAPLDARSLRNAVRDANAKKIPVVILDSDIEREGVELVSFVATDNHKAGVLGGEHLAKLLDGKGNVVLLRYAVGSASTEAREKGFLEAIAKHPGIKLISSNQYAGATAETARKVAGDLLTSLQKEKIDGIFCPNESSSFGMLLALQDRQMAGKMKFVGFDSSPKLLEALKASKIQGLVIQNPFKMGYESVKAAAAALDGKPVEKRIDTGCAVVTPENIAEPAIAAMISPPVESSPK